MGVVAGRHRRMGLGPNYWKLWSASAVSNLGDGVRLTALPLLAAALTRDPLLVAGVTSAAFLPWLLFSLVSGALVDRWDRRRVMVQSNTFRAVAVGVLSAAILLGWESLPLVYVVAFLLGTAETLFDNAASALMPSVVRRDDLETANGRLQAVEIVMNQFVGPPVGGFLFAVGAGIPFLLNSGSFAVSAALLFTLVLVPRAERPVLGARPHLRTEIGEGLRWLWRHRLLRTLAVMLGIVNLMVTAASAILVLFALEVLGVSGTGFGLLLAAYGAGSGVGGLVAKNVSRAVGPGRALFLIVLLWAVLSVVIGTTSNPLVAGAMFAVFGFLGVVWNVITLSLRQAIVPDRLLGRVNSVYRAVGWGSIPVGGVVGGLLAGAFGLRAPWFVAAAVFAAMALACLPLVNNRTVAEARAQAAAPVES